MRKVGGVGLVLLVIVLAVVLLLTARSWRAVAPTAIEIRDHGAGVRVDDHGESGAAEELDDGGLPRLGEAKEETDRHAEDVRQALEATNQ